MKNILQIDGNYFVATTHTKNPDAVIYEISKMKVLGKFQGEKTIEEIKEFLFPEKQFFNRSIQGDPPQYFLKIKAYRNSGELFHEQTFYYTKK